MNSFSDSLKQLDYSILQQCMHCGMCLPSCPTYDATKIERNSPRGRIALMRSIADGEMEVSKIFGEEIYFCLGCLACETVCPAGVQYSHLFEVARHEAEQSQTFRSPWRQFVRFIFLKKLFIHPRLLRALGRILWLYQKSGLQWLLRKSRVFSLLPQYYSDLEKQTPAIQNRFSNQIIPRDQTPKIKNYKIGLLTGCVQDLVFSDVNRDTAEVLLANHCEVVTLPVQYCCGSLHAHNGDLETARKLARYQLDAWKDLETFDAIITNSAGCGSFLKHYDELLKNDLSYHQRAQLWSKKVKDIHEWLVEIDFQAPLHPLPYKGVTYHDACHLCHGQKITTQPRKILKSIPKLNLVELEESAWCCGSAGIYNLIQPEMSQALLDRKLNHILETGCDIVAAANPGCLLQLISGRRERKINISIAHPISLLAQSYRGSNAHS